RRRNMSVSKLRRRFRDWSARVDANDAADDAAEAESPPPVPVQEMFQRDSMMAWIAEHLDDLDDEANDDTADDETADNHGGDGGGRVSVVDPASALMRRKGGAWLQGYKVKAAATTGGLVVAADVTASP